MRVIEKTLPQIEDKLKTMSDFLKMEYLEECAKQNIDMNIKRFCSQELAKLYSGRNMFSEAAKNMSSLADIAVTYREKIQTYMAEVELWIRSGDYDMAEEAFRKALACGNTKEKEEMKKLIKEIYLKQALIYEKANKNSNALKIYEKLLHIADDKEKLDIKKKILLLYGKLGRIRDYTLLKGQIEGV